MNGSNSGLVLRLYYADEQEIQKTNRAHLIKSLLSGNYLMKTFALKHSDFRQLRNWQKESCLFSKCLKQKNRARQTIEAEEHRMAQWAFALQLKVSQILPPRDTWLMSSGNSLKRGIVLYLLNSDVDREDMMSRNITVKLKYQISQFLLQRMFPSGGSRVPVGGLFLQLTGGPWNNFGLMQVNWENRNLVRKVYPHICVEM